MSTACSGSSSNSNKSTGDNSSKAPSGHITVGLGALWPNLDPFVSSTPPRGFWVFSVFSTLTQTVDQGGSVKVVPSASTSWEQTAPNTWQFTLKSGGKFSDGEPLDATSVAETANFMANPANKAGLATVVPIKSASVVSPTVVQFTTPQPTSILPNLIASMPILPAKPLQTQGAKFFSKPFGTGPWQIDAWTPGQELTLTPNPNSLNGLPRARKLTFTLIANDATRIAALQTGKVDLIDAVPTDQFDTLKSGGLDVESSVSPSYVIDLLAKTGPLANPMVRQALNYAVDKDALAKDLLGGAGEPLDGQLPVKGSIGYCPAVKAYPYDPDKAKQLLQQAGVANGTQFTLQTPTGFLVNDSLLAQAIAQMLENVGIKIKVDQMQFSPYLDVFYGRGPRADLYAWRNAEAPSLNALKQYAFYTADTVHNVGYSNPTFQKAYDLASEAPLGSAESDQAYCTMAQTLHDDAPVIFGLALPDAWGVSKSVSGFRDDLTDIPPFDELSK